MSDLACPNCGAELDVATLFASAADQQALSRLAAVSVPMGARVLQYVQLFKPARQSLTARKKVARLLELLPDLERRAITWKGRDWPAPLNAWADAIDQMLAMRDAGRLELPMTAHGYLYAILASLADKAEAAQERQAEADQRGARRAGARLPPVLAAAALAPATSTHLREPATRSAAVTSATVRAMKAEIERRRAPSNAHPHPNPTGEHP